MDIRHPFRNGTQPDQDDRADQTDVVVLRPRRARLRSVTDSPVEDTGRAVKPVVVDGEALPDPTQDQPRDRTPHTEDPDRPATGTGDQDGAPVPAPEPDPDEDEDRTPRAVPVDPPVTRDRVDLPSRARTDQHRNPVLAPWLRDRDELRHVTRWLVSHVWHLFRYHSVRTPVYLLRLAGHSPRGLARTLRTLAAWLSDAEAAPLRREAVDRNAFDEYMHLAKLRRDRMMFRLVLAIPAALVVVTLLGLALTAGLAPSIAAGVVAVVVFGAIGAPADKPILGRSVVTSKAPRLTSELIVRALAGLNIGQINAAVSGKGTGISFPSPIVRDGPGWRAEVDLPYGVTVPEVMDRRVKLASGLRRPLGCVWPEPVDDEHAGRLVLWVGDQPFRKAKAPAWPLAKAGQVDLFKPFPFGTDQRGRKIFLDLMYQSALFGAMPRMGKTFSIRVPVSAAALDPACELRLFEFKGTGDFNAYECVAHRFGSGPEDHVLAACMDSLREVHDMCASRAATLRKHRHLAPESKVTPELAARRSLALHPVLFAIDECQELFTHPQFKDEADRLATAIVKRGPALGIMLALSTQRPDANSLPTGISANVGVRFCLRVMGQTENDMILGTSKYKQGVRATLFTFDDKGIGYLIGALDRPEPIIARSYLIDVPDAERIAARARKLREQAGTLSGHALGELPDHDVPKVSLLDDLILITNTDEDEIWSEIACTRLAELRAEVYRGWNATQLAAALKPYGVATKQVWGTDPDTGEQRNRRGLVRAHLLDARRRHQPHHDSTPDSPANGSATRGEGV